MSIDRRNFARLLALGAGSLALPRSLEALGTISGTDGAIAPHPRRVGGSRSLQETFFDWRTVAPGVRVAFGSGGNVMVVSSSQGSLISDAKNFGFGHTLRREAEALGTPIVLALNTHHHGDHVGGNIALAGNLPLFAHPRARARLEESAGSMTGAAGAERLTGVLERIRADSAPPAVLDDLERAIEEIAEAEPARAIPNRVVSGQLDLRLGEQAVIFRHVGPGHTDNDVFVHLPELNLLHTGDLLFVGRHGFMDQNGGVDSRGWQRSIEAMLELCDDQTVVVPGHGEITDRAGLQRQWDYFEQLREAVATAREGGATRDEVQRLDPPALSDLAGSPARNLGVVWDELEAGG